MARTAITAPTPIRRYPAPVDVARHVGVGALKFAPQETVDRKHQQRAEDKAHEECHAPDTISSDADIVSPPAVGRATSSATGSRTAEARSGVTVATAAPAGQTGPRDPSAAAAAA